MKVWIMVLTLGFLMTSCASGKKIMKKCEGVNGGFFICEEP